MSTTGSAGRSVYQSARSWGRSSESFSFGQPHSQPENSSRVKIEIKMAEVVGVITGIAGLISTAFTLLREIQAARSKVESGSKTLHDASQQLSQLESTLDLVRDQPPLQTAAIEQQLRNIMIVVEELRSFFEGLAKGQRRGRAAQFANALKTGGKEDRDLGGILDRLDRARDLLCMRIQTAQVGLEGNLRDGFRVAFDVLTETNNRVQQVLGINLALMDRLGPISAQQTGSVPVPLPLSQELADPTADRMIAIDVSDQEELGLGDQAAARDTTSHGNEVSIYENFTLGQARIMTGNVGVESWQRVAGRKTTIASNRFEKDVKMMTGDLGGQAAVDFSRNFWT